MRALLRGAPILLAAFVLFGHGSAAVAFAQSPANTDADWTEDKPLAGRAMPCDQGMIKVFECKNVEILSYLPKDGLAGSVGQDIWGWHDSTTGREFAILGWEATIF